MSLRFFLPALALVGLFACTAKADIWINEIDYDQPGTDNAEFVEIAITDAMLNSANGTDSLLILELFNGSSGSTTDDEYNSFDFNDLTFGSATDGVNFYVLNLPSNGIQNGAPDGLGLSLDSGTQLELLSYEGSFTVQGPSSVWDGVATTDIGVSESNGDNPNQSLIRTGAGATGSDFTWATTTSITNGAINAGQSITAIPEPSSIAILGVCGLFGFVRRRK